MAKFGSPRLLAVLAAFSVFLTGVMAETMDQALIGVTVAGVCVILLIIVIVAFLAFCCYRRIESDRKPVLARKDSGSVSTSGVTPRWVPGMVPTGMPIYSMPAEPVMYAVPASHYYLGHYAPKFIDAETMGYMYSGQRQKTEETDEERQRGRQEDHVVQTNHVIRSDHVLMGDQATMTSAQVIRSDQVMDDHVIGNEHVMEDHVVRNEHVMAGNVVRIEQVMGGHVIRTEQVEEDHVTRTEPLMDEQVISDHVVVGEHVIRKDHVILQTQQQEQRESREEVTIQRETSIEVMQMEEPVQSNGNVSNEFSASSLNYKVIRKQHKHEKMPEWLRKSYEEDGKTITLGDDSSEFSDDELVIPPTPEEVVRAQVSPRNSYLDSEDVLQVPTGFTIIDFVDPEERQPRSSSYLPEGGSSRISGEQRLSYTEGSTAVANLDIAIGNLNVTSDVTSTSDVSKDVVVSGNKQITVTTTTTTYYSSQGGGGTEVVETEEGSYMAPASTSTPRPYILPSPPPSPPLPPPPPPFPQSMAVGIGVGATSTASPDLSHFRMRRAGDGSLSNLPEAVANEGAGGYD